MSERFYLGDTVRRTDEDWGEGIFSAVLVHPDMSTECQIKWDGVTGWVPIEKVELVRRATSASAGGDS